MTTAPQSPFRAERLALVPRDADPAPACEAPPPPAIRLNLLAAWPDPPASPWLGGELSTEPEPALLARADGRPVAGKALSVDPSGAVLFLPAGDPGRGDWVRPAEIGSLALTRPLALAVPPASPEALQRRFRLEMDDGSVRLGASAGEARTALGLFLFPPAGDRRVTRLFVPAARVARFEWLAATRPPARLSLEDLEIAPAPAPAPAAPEPARAAPVKDPASLRQALADLAARPIRRLGEVLLEEGLVEAGQLERALAAQREGRDRPLGEILHEMGAVRGEDLKRVLARKLGIPRVDPRAFAIDPGALAQVADALCRRHRLIPLCLDEAGALVVAMDNPMSGEATEALRFATGRRVVPVLGDWPDIRAALGARARDVWAPESVLGPGPSARAGAAAAGADEGLDYDPRDVAELTSRLNLEAPAEDADESDTVRESDSALVRLVNRIIVDAHEAGASDIHIEPAPGRRPTRIRVRRDGVLADYAEVPARFRAALVSRLKIMANLDIAERRKPQDGKIDFSRFGPARLELRVATIPTAGGVENVILRLLAAREPLPADRLGLEEGVLARLREIAGRPHGLVLVAGPTGSGKTTTLHSLVAMINTPERKIWTAEDPVEITQEGLCQVQVNPKIGWTFADALRAFLRADPDVIMIGEMRDRETAATAVEASLTGHLVLSTLHTNSAPETVSRLLDLGVDPFGFGDSLLGVLAQRLVRRVCPACARREPLGDEGARALAREHAAACGADEAAMLAGWRARHGRDGGLWLARGEGCGECDGSGYRGRIGVHEFLGVGPRVRALIHARAPAEALREAAVGEGMRTLREDGIGKALAGLTTLEQVRAACA